MLDTQTANDIIRLSIALVFCVAAFFGGQWVGLEQVKKDDPYRAMPSQQAALLKGIAMLGNAPMEQVLIQEAVSKSSPCVADPKAATKLKREAK